MSIDFNAVIGRVKKGIRFSFLPSKGSLLEDVKEYNLQVFFKSPMSRIISENRPVKYIIVDVYNEELSDSEFEKEFWQIISNLMMNATTTRIFINQKTKRFLWEYVDSS